MQRVRTHTTPDYFAAISLGQTHDRAALALCECVEVSNEPGCLIRGLKRWDAGASYPAICEDVGKLLKSGGLTTAPLIVDITMAGLPIGRLFEKAINRTFYATITGGDAEIKDESISNAYRVPKRLLVSTVQMLLQTERLKIAPGMGEAENLIRDLSSFRLNKSESAAEATSLLWRESAQDDLVFAVSISCWAALANYFQRASAPAVGKPIRKLVAYRVI